MQKSHFNSDLEINRRESTAVDSRGFPERLRLAMKGRSIREFASSASMSAGTLHNYLNNESLPTLDKLLALVNTANVNLNWLATGVSPMYLGGDTNESEDPQRKIGDTKILTMIMECVEEVVDELGIGVTVQKKCAVTSSIYDMIRDQDKKVISREKIHKVILSTFSK